MEGVAAEVESFAEGSCGAGSREGEFRAGSSVSTFNLNQAKRQNLEEASQPPRKNCPVRLLKTL
jgi:hypothetical protein